MTEKKKSFKTRWLSFVLVLAAVFALVPINEAHAATSYYNGGIGTVYTSTTVYTSDDLSTKKGSLDKYETFTILQVCNNSYYIDYSTSNGHKMGYIDKNGLVIEKIAATCVGYVNTSTNVYYYMPYGTVAGSVSAGEYVAVLASNRNGYFYIEYNTNSGRKRGYVPVNSITYYMGDQNQFLAYEYMSDGTEYSYMHSGTASIYRVPNTLYAADGSVGNEVIVVMSEFTACGHKWQFVRYHVGNSDGLWKTGYLMIG